MRRSVAQDPQAAALARALRPLVPPQPVVPFVRRNLAAEAEKRYDAEESRRLAATPPAPKPT